MVGWYHSMACGSISRPNRRERIETISMINDTASDRISRPNRRERIETLAIELRQWYPVRVSPGLTAGSGLKLMTGSRRISSFDCISRPNRRERIETRYRHTNVIATSVSPGLTAGSGLKHFVEPTQARHQLYLPA